MINLINKIRDISYREANSTIHKICGIVDFFSSEEDKENFIHSNECVQECVQDDKVAYGDWQTPQALALEVCQRHLACFGMPDIVIEPTCGIGAFVLAALEVFENANEIYAIEINPTYTSILKNKILLRALQQTIQQSPNIHIVNADFFKFDFSTIFTKIEQQRRRLAIIGNPPWVTNSGEGKISAENLPIKINKYKYKGIEARLGKSNFDISEAITLYLLGYSENIKGGISFLLKNSVIRNIVQKQKAFPLNIGNISQESINAKKEFNVSVEASSFTAELGSVPTTRCMVSDFYNHKHLYEYGWVRESFVSNVSLYHKYSAFDKKSSYTWRSGVKHDCAPILELRSTDGRLINGLGETVVIEEDLIYPLLKSSDINSYSGKFFERYIIIPQKDISHSNINLQSSHPLAYEYLNRHRDYFLKRKSSIYRNKEIFSIFGIGEYSFKPYKILVSSLYKSLRFILVKSYKEKPIMVDDTCYQLDFDDIDEAEEVYEALNSEEIQSLFQSLVFSDSKRVVTKELLMRIDLLGYCHSKDLSKNKVRKPLDSKWKQMSIFDIITP